ncbi:MAG: LytTR family transcriptional regulator DNA-binding domain-containing protein [Saprospiraceae bacterium]|nr:LytTR family transcriptional regulator DNA-binding domain-containing protein [Saprospiraceae bacterium]
MEKINEQLSQDFVFLKDDSKLHYVPLRDIFFVKGEGNYSIVHTRERKFVMRSSLKRFFEILPQLQFVQIHRSYIVQIPHIKLIDLGEGQVHLQSQEVLPVSRRFRLELVSTLPVF